MTEQPIHKKVAAAKAALAAANQERADLQALAMLVEHNGVQDAPTRIDLIGGGAREVLVGIGKDHTARIIIFEDGIEALQRLLGQENTDGES